jgi:hypothetical protein
VAGPGDRLPSWKGKTRANAAAINLPPAKAFLRRARSRFAATQRGEKH